MLGLIGVDEPDSVHEMVPPYLGGPLERIAGTHLSHRRTKKTGNAVTSKKKNRFS
jgi:hypothetical protein